MIKGTIYNPFRVEGVDSKSITTKGGVYEFADKETGEMIPFQRLSKGQTILHDSKTYTKVFHESREILMKLSPAGAKLFLFMLPYLKPNWDTVFLPATDTCAACEFSESTYKRAIEELIKQNVLGRKLGSSIEFWINPNIMYNGDRTRLFSKNKQNTQANKE